MTDITKKNKNLPYPFNLFIDIYGETTDDIYTQFDCTVCFNLKNIITDKRHFSERTIRIVLLRYHDKLSYKEISLKENIPISEIRNRMKYLGRKLYHPSYRNIIGVNRRYKCYTYGSATKMHPRAPVSQKEWNNYNKYVDIDTALKWIAESIIKEEILYRNSSIVKLQSYLSEISNQLDESK